MRVDQTTVQGFAAFVVVLFWLLTFGLMAEAYALTKVKRKLAQRQLSKPNC